ncbi:MAG: hypothetical protein FWE40_03685 [Oscillospiraceae bacterium]|nr:hypothetical protein [Oscillospiraceae bacterium]
MPTDPPNFFLRSDGEVTYWLERGINRAFHLGTYLLIIRELAPNEVEDYIRATQLRLHRQSLPRQLISLEEAYITWQH